MAKVTHYPQYRIVLRRFKKRGWHNASVEVCLQTKLNGKTTDLQVLFRCYERPQSVDEALEKYGKVKSTLLAADESNLFFLGEDDE